MKKLFHGIAIITLLLFVSCSLLKPKADLIIHNATVYTVDDQFTRATTLIIHDGVILIAGGEELLDHFDAREILDAGGKFVYPGFYDAHCHFLSYGQSKLQRADLAGTSSYDEVLQKVKEHADQNPSEWIEGRGWDQNDWDVKQFPGRKELDQLFPDRPVYLTRIDGHAALVNGEALRRAGITAETRVEGGEIILMDGIPGGVLIDNAMDLVRDLIPKNDPAMNSAALLKAQEDCIAVGLTSVMDAGLPVKEILLIDSLNKANLLKININAMLSSSDTAYLDFMKKGEYRTDKLHVNSVKLYADGALGSRGAAMIDEYSDDHGNHGLIMHSDDYYREVLDNAYKYNYQVNTHAIGDKGNRYTLELYAEYLKGPNDRRWRVEHAQIVHPDDFDTFGAYSIIPSIQATHCTSDMYWADERVGEERIKGAYAWQKLLKQNGWLPNGTDFPIEHISPLRTFFASVSRMDLEGYPEDGFQAEEALSREEALRSITMWAAKAAFEENEKGSLENGKKADIVILEEDLMTVPADKIPYIRITHTYIDGELVYSSDPE